MPVGSHEVMGLGTPVKLDLATATTSDGVPTGRPSSPRPLSERGELAGL